MFAIRRSARNNLTTDAITPQLFNSNKLVDAAHHILGEARGNIRVLIFPLVKLLHLFYTDNVMA